MAGFMMLLISGGLVAAHAWRGPTFNRGVRNRNRVINQNSFNQQDVVWTRAQDSCSHVSDGLISADYPLIWTVMSLGGGGGGLGSIFVGEG